MGRSQAGFQPARESPEGTLHAAHSRRTACLRSRTGDTDMKARRHVLEGAVTSSLVALATGLLLTACGAPPATPTQTAAPPTTAVPAMTLNTSYNELMVAWIDNASHVLWDVERQSLAPKNEADWVELEDHAIQLAAAGALIQLHGAGPRDG